GLDALTDREVAAAVGNAMFADLTSLAGQIYKYGQGYGQSGKTPKNKLALHADEFNELIGDEFIPMLNKAGGAGYQVTAYTQTWADVEARLGSNPKALQMAGNFNTMIMLRVLTENTAQMLTERLPEVRVVTGTLVSGAGDIAEMTKQEDFTSKNEDRISSETVPMLAPSDLCNLPKGQCFALLEGGHLYKIRLPLPKPATDKDVPQNLWQVAERMREDVRLSQATETATSPFTQGKTYNKTQEDKK
ncbi:MAG: TraM recognition domain-containing protein, partial [Neisseriaceae bacterium]|nr:TraM recognition domain-containing protein [Neisseriaceae bacterium]